MLLCLHITNTQYLSIQLQISHSPVKLLVARLNPTVFPDREIEALPRPWWHSLAGSVLGAVSFRLRIPGVGSEKHTHDTHPRNQPHRAPGIPVSTANHPLPHFLLQHYFLGEGGHSLPVPVVFLTMAFTKARNDRSPPMMATSLVQGWRLYILHSLWYRLK